ncbi:hypothetical protein D3C71_1628950 [compost metagenome]
MGLRGVSRMDAATKPPWTDSRRPRKPTVPRHPTECAPLLLLRLLLLLLLLRVQGAALQKNTLQELQDSIEQPARLSAHAGRLPA